MGKAWNYGLAALIFLGSYTSPMLTRAEVLTAPVKQHFFDTIVDYARDKRLKITKINANDVEIKGKVVTAKGEPAEGIFNVSTRKIDIKDSKLENIATVSIHELTHREKYDPLQETELWFKEIPFKLEQREDGYLATVDTTNLKGVNRLSQYIPKLIIKKEINKFGDSYVLYDLKGNRLKELELEKIIANDNSTVRIRIANFPIMGVKGKFYYEEGSNILYYMPSEIMEFYNEIIARIYEQIFSGYYAWNKGYPRNPSNEISTLGKSLANLTLKNNNLSPEQKRICQNAEEAYVRLNEHALLEIIEKTIQLGGKHFREAMEDLQDETFAKSISLASVILTNEDFQNLLDVYDNNGKEKVKKLLSMQMKELYEKKKIGSLKESDIIRMYLKKFNLNDEEVELVMKYTIPKSFDEIFKSRQKIKHIETIKKLNLEKLLNRYIGHEKAITKGL